MAKNYAAVVFTSVERLPDGRMCGYWLPEAAYPWFALAGAGLSVVAVTVDEAVPRAGGTDRTDPVQRRFLDDERIQTALATSRKPEFYQPDDFAAVVLTGGAGAAFDLPNAAGLGGFAGAVLADGGVVACSGYGAAGLLAVADADPQALRGRKVTATSPAEERAQDLSGMVPLRLAEELAERGAVVQFGEAFRPHAVADRALITGQNPGSAPLVARHLLEALLVQRQS